jgi:hypothetical protein
VSGAIFPIQAFSMTFFRPGLGPLPESGETPIQSRRAGLPSERREDVVETIRLQIEERGFAVEHAVLVRPVNSHLGIISGHQRVEAARRAQLTTIPAWNRSLVVVESIRVPVYAFSPNDRSPGQTFSSVGKHFCPSIPGT